MDEHAGRRPHADGGVRIGDQRRDDEPPERTAFVVEPADLVSAGVACSASACPLSAAWPVSVIAVSAVTVTGPPGVVSSTSRVTTTVPLNSGTAMRSSATR